jgi:hypothetical protein
MAAATQCTALGSMLYRAVPASAWHKRTSWQDQRVHHLRAAQNMRTALLEARLNGSSSSLKGCAPVQPLLGPAAEAGHYLSGIIPTHKGMPGPPREPASKEEGRGAAQPEAVEDATSCCSCPQSSTSTSRTAHASNGPNNHRRYTKLDSLHSAALPQRFGSVVAYTWKPATPSEHCTACGTCLPHSPAQRHTLHHLHLHLDPGLSHDMQQGLLCCDGTSGISRAQLHSPASEVHILRRRGRQHRTVSQPQPQPQPLPLRQQPIPILPPILPSIPPPILPPILPASRLLWVVRCKLRTASGVTAWCHQHPRSAAEARLL